MVNDSANSAEGTDRNRFLQGFRHVLDPLVCLLIAVLLVRTFLVQGYLISTGSMAPHYYGRHQLATCPKCGYRFAVGTEFDKQISLSEHASRDWAVCPNCLADEAELTDLPVNRGDHLLVWKDAYAFREPRRWEVVVFQNPNEPGSTYIKRVAGLPGEELQIREGNLWIDGELARKPLSIQRALLIPVFDTTFQPADDETWTPRWSADSERTGWSQTGTVWRYLPDAASDVSDDRLTFRHTLRYGGSQQTVVPLRAPLSPDALAAFQEKSAPFPFAPEPAFPGLHYDEAAHSLVATGVIPESVRHKLESLDSSPEFQAAVDRVIAQSRIAPVTDFCAYNHQSVSLKEHPISEFLLEAIINPETHDGKIVVSLATLEGEFRCELDLELLRIRLVNASNSQTLREAVLSPDSIESFGLEFSSIDRQLCVAVNGRELFEPWALDPLVPNQQMPPEIAGISGTIPCEVTSLKLYRDVFYTPELSERAVVQPFPIPKQEYFVLGDNSPVSYDSRRWEIPTVPRRLLIGKPFLVHLPSTQEKLVWRGREFRYRQPDFSRMRFVR